MRKLIITLLFFVLSTSLLGGGFQINEHGARAMSMGNAFTALADDASAVYFNPAAITFLEKDQIMVGFSIIKPEATFRGPFPATTEYKLDNQYFNPINLYYAKKLNEDFSFGLALNNPFGMGTKWDEDWVGRFLSVESDLKTFFLTPSFSFKIFPNLSMGFGVSYVYGDVLIERKFSNAPFEGEGDMKLEGDDAASYGYSVSMLYKPMDNLSFGFKYKSEVGLEFEGEAKVVAPNQLLPIIPKGDIAANLDLPADLLIGVAYSPVDYINLTAELQYVWWSSYDKMYIRFLENESWNKSSPRDYKDTYILRTGVEWLVNNELALRSGIFYDKHPVKDKMAEPSLPDSDRLGLNFGFGYRFLDNFNVDFAYLFLRFDEKRIDETETSYTNGDAPLTGVYNAITHVLALNLSYDL
ncbi:MAG: hypothetical protein CR982_06475 [Candidatus Cloacimonadota bacterium]|nr:MAG: hypothetical protein CR982_06475 [Candidatus Cloacimonadota bacterium]PIE79934.1 MAG: hypothetical protein CSA15_02395 [Candidatus Delongbacteria bacterium]